MQFLTDRKRATGLGSAREGTNRHWFMTVTAYAMILLVPLFLIAFGPILGASHDEVVAHFARPFPAIVTILMLWVGLMHFKSGVRIMIEDYVHGFAREFWIIAMACVSYALAATGTFAVLKMAL